MTAVITMSPERKFKLKKGRKITNLLKPPITLSLNNLAKLGGPENGKFEDHYELGRKVGEGRFGATYECRDKKSGEILACKIVKKSRMVMLGVPVREIRREVAIMHHVSGNENTVTIYEAYEDPRAIHIVMELCTGGELYERIANSERYSEYRAATLARSIINVVQICHSVGIVHRDLKPENFLFATKDEDAPLKLIDFGLSVFFRPGQPVSNRLAGSPMFIAPEMIACINENDSENDNEPSVSCSGYGPEIDVWSAGVIIYILLCGYPPFSRGFAAVKDIFQAITSQPLDLTSPPWPCISEHAKNLLRGMLEKDPKKRLTAEKALCHPWICEGVAPTTPHPPAVLIRLRTFAAMSRFKKIAIRVIAEGLEIEEIAGLREMFESLDVDHSGTISLEKLRVGLQKLDSSVSDSEVERLLIAADVDNNHLIDYGEFLAATLQMNRAVREDNLLRAFQYFDSNGDGKISADELRSVCRELKIMDEECVKQMMSEMDKNLDGFIDYEEFVAMMCESTAGRVSGQSAVDRTQTLNDPDF